MKIRFIKGTTMAGGKPVNPGEVHDVGDEEARRFVHLFKDAVYHVEEPAAPAKAEAVATPIAQDAEATKGKKKL